ncbi:hypothetical protein FGADI_8313 [Fusarium gaditjirri]|uniref:Uncharacterized protein n=1 Tax=Fusarium gaditjirri TaxID=282569 RepID=A0A8H4T2W7_9HYPO|nr:hypothetical protein FGADI_8313 [Fusarium gaditjirri]
MVVVTGGSSGIGKEIVLKLAKRRIKVTIVDLDAPSYRLPPNVSFFSADLSDATEISRVAKQIVSDHGDPTVLINNAGIGSPMSILTCLESKIRKVFEVNMIAPIFLAKHFLPAMIRRNHGHVVNVRSMASFSTQATNVDYGCTKSGLLALNEGLLQEMNIIHPTWVKTPLIANLIAKGKLKDDAVSAERVADAIVDQLHTGYGAQVVVPNSLAWASMMRGLPSWIQEGLRDKVSASLLNAMDS